jgi:hypothetical protein
LKASLKGCRDGRGFGLFCDEKGQTYEYDQGDADTFDEHEGAMQ